MTGLTPRRVFGTSGLPGDWASLAISARDAADRVGMASSADDRMALLQRATRNGDEALARAVADYAIRNQDTPLVNEFLDTRPHLTEATQRLWDREQRSDSQVAFALTMRMMGLRP